MKLYNQTEMSIEITKDEYLKICAEANERLPYMYQYDLIEIECSDIDVLKITDWLLDECRDGFYMWSKTFYELFARYTDWPNVHYEDVVEVHI